MIRLATCLTLPEPDPDREPLDDALAAAGVPFEWVAWEDPAVDWDAPVPTILRSTWNYSLDRDGFLAWCDRVARAAPLWNPPDVIRANTHKRYLLELAARGVATVPTVLIERGATPGVAALARERGWSRLVVKPAIGAGSLDARVFDAGEHDAAEAHAAALAARVEVLVQPYLTSVDDHGERSLVWIDGALSHAIRKAPRFAGDDERVTGPHPIDPAEREVALAALAPWAARILYGRVDLARDAAGAPVVMELELAEPSLFFARGAGSAERLVAGLRRRLSA
jgi:glutathione synthase/RimK-type ligase-like ATP-grasp enzyme